MTSKDASFLHRQADRCIALSRSTFDLTIAGRLRDMAAEFRARAVACEDESSADGVDDDFRPGRSRHIGSMHSQSGGR